MFIHVEDTIQNGIEMGMSLEVPFKKEDATEDQEPLFWVASIVMVCGPLLRLRYFGGDDRSLEFWFNLTKEAAHELGWSTKNGKTLEPPAKVLERSPDCKEKLQDFLSSAKSIPVEMLTGVCNLKIFRMFIILYIKLTLKFFNFRMVVWLTELNMG